MCHVKQALMFFFEGYTVHVTANCSYCYYNLLSRCVIVIWLLFFVLYYNSNFIVSPRLWSGTQRDIVSMILCDNESDDAGNCSSMSIIFETLTVQIPKVNCN